MHKSRGVQVHGLGGPGFASACDVALFRAWPDLAKPHLTGFRTGRGEVAIAQRDGQPFDVIRPEEHVGLLTLDAVQTRVPPPGAHRFRATGHKPGGKLIDTRWRTRDETA